MYLGLVDRRRIMLGYLWKEVGMVIWGMGDEGFGSFCCGYLGFYEEDVVWVDFGGNGGYWDIRT